MDHPPVQDLNRLEAALGAAVTAARRIQRGYTPAERWVLSLDDGRSAFAKVAVNENTASWLHTEHRVYQGLREQDADFLPELLHFVDDTERPILILEDLSSAHWPPPWSSTQIAAVRALLDRVHALHLPLNRLSFIGQEFAGWGTVAEDPKPFLALGLTGANWLKSALPTLLAAQAEVELDGNALLHLDVRSDNLCFMGERAILIDWNHACLGNPLIDLGFWLPSLASEGGPQPEAVIPGNGQLAALIAGFFAWRAGLPLIPSAPRVREIQRTQLETALPWAQRALGLPPLASA